MKYTTPTGEVYLAQDAEDLVHQLREASFTPEVTDERYMAQMAKTYREASGDEVRSGSPREFVEDLVKVGFLKEEEDDAE